jgi:hypothetical protein
MEMGAGVVDVIVVAMVVVTGLAMEVVEVLMREVVVQGVTVIVEVVAEVGVVVAVVVEVATVVVVGPVHSYCANQKKLHPSRLKGLLMDRSLARLLGQISLRTAMDLGQSPRVWPHQCQLKSSPLGPQLPRSQ